MDFVSVQTGGSGVEMISVFSRAPIQEGQDGDGRGEEEDESALVARPAAKLCNKELLAKQRTNFPHSILLMASAAPHKYGESSWLGMARDELDEYTMN